MPWLGDLRTLSSAGVCTPSPGHAAGETHSLLCRHTQSPGAHSCSSSRKRACVSVCFSHKHARKVPQVVCRLAISPRPSNPSSLPSPSPLLSLPSSLPPLPLLCLLPTPPSPRVLHRLRRAPEPSPAHLSVPREVNLSAPTKPTNYGEQTLLRAGLSPLTRAAGRRRWGIGPGGHPMGGVSAARPELELRGEGGGGSGDPLLGLCAVSPDCQAGEEEP